MINPTENEERLIHRINQIERTLSVQETENVTTSYNDPIIVNNNISSYSGSELYSTITSAYSNNNLVLKNSSYGDSLDIFENTKELEDIMEKYCPFSKKSEQAHLWRQGFYDAAAILNGYRINKFSRNNEDAVSYKYSTNSEPSTREVVDDNEGFEIIEEESNHEVE